MWKHTKIMHYYTYNNNNNVDSNVDTQEDAGLGC